MGRCIESAKELTCDLIKKEIEKEDERITIIRRWRNVKLDFPIENKL